jgi:hypothetical protein
MGSLAGPLAGAGVVLAAGAVVLLLHRYGDGILRWLASLRRASQPHGYVPLMGPPDPRRVTDAPESPPEPPPLPSGNPPPGGQGWPYAHLELSGDPDGAMHATVVCDGRAVAIFTVDTLGGMSAIGTDDLLAELQRRGDLAELMEHLHWQLPLEDLLAEVAKRAGAG